jgi:hypothetical protein
VSQINPGSGPVEGAGEAAAVETMAVFAAEVGVDPVRAPELDTDGRYGWRFGDTPVLMPGVAVTAVRDDMRATAPCIRVGESWWWWRDAVGQIKP